MAWKRKLCEYEADLYRVPKPRFFRFPKGEIEYKAFDDGERQLEIKFYGIKAPDGTTVELLVDGTPGLTVSLKNGRVNTKLSSSAGHSIPEMLDGNVAEISHEGTVLLRGTFKPDK
jgi:hypothetical protein